MQKKFTDDDKRRFFQKVKMMTQAQFFMTIDAISTEAYKMGVDHMVEAMSCHKRISKPMIQEVLKKKTEIRSKWDGISVYTHPVEVNGTYPIAADVKKEGQK